MSNLPSKRLKISELSETEYFKKQNDVVDRFLKSQKIEDIARSTGLQRAAVITFIDEWKNFVRNDKTFKEMGQERLHEMDRHYGLIIASMWENHDALVDAEKHADAGSLAKKIAEVEEKRQTALQKAGLYEDNELTEMMMETERKQEAIKQFLMNLVEDYPDLRNRIVEGLRQVEDPSYTPPVDLDVVEGEVEDE